MASYQPPRLFTNPHVQSIFATTGPRKFLVRRRARDLLDRAQTHALDCGDGIVLQGQYSSKPENNNGLVIMIHGWLGCDESLYLLSAGSRLFAEGYNIFRLNLRDHGDTLHLNKELFNSTRIKEVVGAVRAIQQRFPHSRNMLCGFSLGGNFSLRVAIRATDNGIKLDKVVAICPVINPYKTNRNLHQGLFIYHDYFKKKWMRSLELKQRHFPEYNFVSVLKQLKTLDDMNQHFVPQHTDYENVDDYLMGYAIGGDVMAPLDIRCHIISSEDDPVIEAADLQELAPNPNLTIELTRHGGHCGYIDSFALTSWIDQRLVELFNGCE